MAIDANGLYIPEVNTGSTIFGSTSSMGANTGGLNQQLSPTQTQAVDTGGGTGGYGAIGAGISAISGAIQGQMETKAFKDKLSYDTNIAIQNVGNIMTSFELQQVQNKEQIENINHILGDKLSERSLNALKEASLLKTASVETGTSGGTTEMAVKEAFINENMDKANYVSAARQQTMNIMKTMDTALLGTQHNIDSVLIGGASVGTDTALAGLAGGLGAFTNTLGMMTDEEHRLQQWVKPKHQVFKVELLLIGLQDLLKTLERCLIML